MVAAPPKSLSQPVVRPQEKGSVAVLDDAELVARLKQGDFEAGKVLFERHERKIYALAHKLLHRSEDARDIAQDAFVTAIDKIGTLRDGGAFAGWLRSILVRKARDMMRRGALLRRLGLASPEAPEIIEGSSSPLGAVYASELRERLEVLTPEEHLVMLLHRGEGMSLDEVVTATGMSRSTVKRRLRAAIERLGLSPTEDAS